MSWPMPAFTGQWRMCADGKLRPVVRDDADSFLVSSELDPARLSGATPVAIDQELASDIREHNERVARDVEAAKWRQLCATSERLVAEVSAPSEYSPVATVAGRSVDMARAVAARLDEAYRAAPRPPVRDYCAELRAQLAAVGATVTLPKRPQDIDVYRVAPGHSVKAGQAVSVDAAGFVRPISAPRAVSSVAQLAAQDAARCHEGSWSTVPPSREDERRAIDALLREDARRTPVFATARRAAVLAYCENHNGATVDNAATMLAWCRGYEERRGGMSKPAQAAADWLDRNDVTDTEWTAMGHYERARGMR